MYNLIEHSNNYSKISGILYQCCRDEPVINAANDNTFDFNADNATTDLDKIKEKVAGKIGDDGTKNAEVMVSLKYLSTLWRTPEMPLFNCEINLDLNWSEQCLIVATAVANQGANAQ